MKTLLLFKAESIPAGAHWITVRPHGPGSDGQPLLVQDQSDGSMKVLGGAGGSLNHLRLRGTKSGEDRKAAALRRQQDIKERRKAQVAADKESGAWQAKQEARAHLSGARKQAEQAFVSTVAEHLGWDKDSLAFDRSKYAHLSDRAVDKLERQHHAMLLKRARDVAQQQRDWLVNDHEARTAAGIGELPLSSDAGLSVADLDPVRSVSSGPRVTADYAERAEANGAGAAEIKQEAQAVRLEGKTPEQRQHALERGEAASMIRQEVAGISPELPDVAAKVSDARKAAGILAARKQLALAQQQLRQANKAVDRGQVLEPRALALDVDDAEVAESVARDIEQDLRTQATRSFLARAGEVGSREDMHGHIAAGAFQSLNGLALAVGGAGLVDRSVVDVLGIDGAAQVLARRLQADLSPEDYAHTVAGMEAYHKAHYLEAGQAAIDQAGEALEALKGIKLDDAQSLEEAQALNAKRRDLIDAARSSVGTALGEMECNAALVASLKRGKADQVQVPMGSLGPEAIVQQARALGLQRGDYRVERVGDEHFLTVHGSGMDRLAAPVDGDELRRINRNQAIMRGDFDQDGWLPVGFADRRDLAAPVQPGVAPTLARPFTPGPDLSKSIRDYVGGRMADGDAPSDILADLQSATLLERSGNPGAYLDALREVVPTKDEAGKLRTVESLTPLLEQYADDFVQSAYGGSRQPIHKQSFALDETAVEAAHRALSASPEGVAAYKPIGELTHQDQRALRDYFYKHVARESDEAAAVRAELDGLGDAEPEQFETDMFGEQVTNPAWQDWKTQRDDLAGRLSSLSLTWQDYVHGLGGNARAYEALQDAVRSKVSKDFAAALATVAPDRALKLGKTIIRHNLRHLGMIDPAARDRQAAEQARLIDQLRERTASGQYASGSVLDRVDEYKAEKAAYQQAQMGFFSTEELDQGDLFGGAPNDAEVKAPTVAPGERFTLGHVAEQQLGQLIGAIGPGFKPGQPVKLWHASMSGKFAPQQRAVKLVEANKRVALAFGAGSGKTAIMLGTHAQLAGTGKIKRSLMLVPSVVQGQFGGEALRYLKPGQFKWHAEPGASRAERIQALQDPDTHFCVMTHQSFRDDMVHLGAASAGISEADMADRLHAMKPAERQSWLEGVLQQHGMAFDASMVDEAHDTVNRDGKEDSLLSNVVDALTDHTPYFVYASGDPVKNDPSELADVMAKMDRSRYGDKGAFLRRYGINTEAAKGGLKRELARHVYSSTIAPDVAINRQVDHVPLSSPQKAALVSLDQAAGRLRLSKMRGAPDVAAARQLAPEAFAGQPEAKHAEIAAEVAKTASLARVAARRRILNEHPEGGKLDAMMAHVNARPGQQGVVFAHSLKAVEQIKARLEAEGKRVVTITGADSSKDKDAKRRAFNPDSGDPSADILVASDAAAVGLNLQSGRYLIQHDTPDTAKNHGQREARIARLGQKNGVDLIDLVHDHPDEYRARDRLAKKYGLRRMMLSPMDGLDDTGVAYHIAQQRAQAQQASMF